MTLQEIRAALAQAIDLVDRCATDARAGGAYAANVQLERAVNQLTLAYNTLLNEIESAKMRADTAQEMRR